MKINQRKSVPKSMKVVWERIKNPVSIKTVFSKKTVIMTE